MASTAPVVIVTGASRGIGKATCLELVKAGARVVGFARSTEELEKLSQECQEVVPGCEFVYQVGDVTSEEMCVRTIDLAVQRFGRIDALVNNAAALAPMSKLAEVSKADLAAHFDVNLFSVLTLTQKALPELRKSHGKVINISSGSAVSPLVAWGSYCCSKAALNMLTANMALEDTDVTFFALRPGVVDTNMQTTVRSTGATKMNPSDHEKFVGFSENGILLNPSVPGHIIANLSLHLDHSLSGKFYSWDSDELASYRA